MATQIKLRRDTAANWASEDPVLAQGEPGYDTTNKILKIGDGSTIWSLLPSIYDPSTDIIPATDNTYDLGSPDKQWRHVYTAGGSIYLDNIKLTNVNGKFVATTVINPGQENEAEDPEDSNATSQIGGGVTGLEGFVNNEGDPGEESYKLVLDEQLTIRTHYASNAEPNNGFAIGRGIDGGTRANGVVAIGNDDVGYNSKPGGVYIGYQAGWLSDESHEDQGENAIAIGAKAAYSFAPDNSITLNATGANLNPTGAGLFIKPVREDVENTIKAVYYNTTTGEMTYADPTGGSGVPDASNVWVQTFESTDAGDVVAIAVSVEYDAGGNIIALFVHGSSTEPYTSYYSVGKYTTTGTRIWTARFADEFNTDGWGLAVDQSNGYIYIAGKMNTEGGQYNSTLTKISGTDGSIVWSKKYDFGSNSASNVVDVASDGNPVMVGYAEFEGDKYVATTKIDAADGTVIWAKALDGQGNENALGMAVGPNGEVVAIGYMAQLGYEGDTADHMLVVKYDSSGTIQWQKAILFDTGFDCSGADADIDSNGNIYVVGQYEMDLNPGTTSAMSIVKFNSSGVKQWSRRVVGDCETFGSSIVVGPDDKLYLSGMTLNNNAGDFIWVTAKYDFNGTVEWQRLIDNTSSWSFTGNFVSGPDGVGGSNIAVKDGYVALGGGFGNLMNSETPHATVLQVQSSGDLFTVGSWDFKQANFTGTLNSSASDITVVDADKDDYDNGGNIDYGTVSLDFDTSNFLIGTLYPTAVVDNTVGFTVLADGTLQALAGAVDSTTLTSTLQNGRPDWLMITPRSLDRSIIDTQYGFDGTGMWFTGNNEETLIEQPAYPIHTKDAFPADVKVVVEFDISLVSGDEDWGICVYPANGIPHWNWDPHPSRIAAIVDCSIGEGPYVQAVIHGLTNSSYGGETSDVARARFTYDPIAERTTLEVLNADGAVTARAELPGRLDRGQDYMIGFDGDWDDAEPGDKSYFSNLTITTSASATKATEFTVSGEVKLPNTVRGFVNMEGPWINNEDSIKFQTVTTHDGFAYMGGESDYGDSNKTRINKYSLTTGELVWTRVLGAGRSAQFDISWTGGVYTITNIANTGIGYQAGNVLYIPGWAFGGDGALNRAAVTVQSVDDQGAIVTATIAGTAPSGTDSTSAVSEYYTDAQGWPVSIKYDTVSDTVVVLTQQSMFNNGDDIYLDQAGVIRINPVSGDVVSNTTLTDEGDMYPIDVAVHPTTGATAVVGTKFNEYKQFGTLTMLAKGNGYFDILKSNLDDEHWPGNQIPSDPIYNFLISGTGIATTHSVDNVNYYEGISGTTRQGSGAEFTVVANDGDPGIYTVTVTSGGSYYLVGHKIKILGTSLGGTTPANDLILTISAINPSVTVTASGTADGGARTEYTGVTGTNLDVGSGLTLNISVDTLTGSRMADVNQGGSNYVGGDVVIIAGTQFANGATPANDVEVTVVGVGGSGNVGSAVTAGTTPTNAIRILVNGVDFTVGGGSWSMKQNLDGEAFVWTPDWNKAIGGGTYDEFQSVVYSKDGSSIYAVGGGYYEVDYRQSLVVKFATSDGTIQFSKYLNSSTNQSVATGVATIGTSDIVVSGWEYNIIDGINRYQQFVARMTSGGTVVWKKFYGDGNWGNGLDYNCDIQVDSDDNIYVTMKLSPDVVYGQSSNGFTVTKLDKDGNKLWGRCVYGNDSSYLGDSYGNRWSSLHGDQLVVAGYTYETDDDYYNSLWVSIPTDGFTYLGGENNFAQMGAFRLGEGRIVDGVRTLDVGNTFTPSVQPPNITAVTDLRNYATRIPFGLYPQHLHKMVDPKHGGVVFGDGTRQTTAADRIPQIRGDNDYTITENDSGKHIYFRNNNGTVTIPGWWAVNLPVGFTFTIVNRTGSDCWVRLEGWPGAVGTILGAGRNLDYEEWGIPDSGSGSMVTLIKLEDGHDYYNGGQQDGQIWMISGPGDIYIND